jgi:hypothetical protein
MKTSGIALSAFFLTAPTPTDLAVFAASAIADPMQSRPQICPHFLAQYCAKFPGGAIRATWTNSCLACRRHLTLLHQGACGNPA